MVFAHELAKSDENDPLIIKKYLKGDLIICKD
jgi:hypothetical protein